MMRELEEHERRAENLRNELERAGFDTSPIRQASDSPRTSSGTAAARIVSPASVWGVREQCMEAGVTAAVVSVPEFPALPPKTSGAIRKMMGTGKFPKLVANITS